MTDLANADASEEDKLKAMMKQSGEDWDPSQYVNTSHVELLFQSWTVMIKKIIQTSVT